VISSQAKRLSALWALCHGNNEHVGILANSEEFFRCWSKAIDDCIRKDSDPLLASLCLGLGATVFVNGTEQQQRLIGGAPPSKIASLLGKCPQSASIIIHSFALLGHLIQGITDLDHEREIIEALRIAVDTWKKFHMENKEVCYAILENLSFFVKQYASVLTQRNIPELVLESLMMHRDCPLVQKYGTTLLDSMKKTEFRQPRESILPTPKLRPVVEVRGHFIYFIYFFRLEPLFVHSTKDRGSISATGKSIILTEKSGPSIDKVTDLFECCFCLCSISVSAPLFTSGKFLFLFEVVRGNDCRFDNVLSSEERT
jgi:hypothetical protein